MILIIMRLIYTEVKYYNLFTNTLTDKCFKLIHTTMCFYKIVKLYLIQSFLV